MSKTDYNTLYAKNAPRFLAFLEAEEEKIKAQMGRFGVSAEDDATAELPKTGLRRLIPTRRKNEDTEDDGTESDPAAPVESSAEPVQDSLEAAPRIASDADSGQNSAENDAAGQDSGAQIVSENEIDGMARKLPPVKDVQIHPNAGVKVEGKAPKQAQGEASAQGKAPKIQPGDTPLAWIQDPTPIMGDEPQAPISADSALSTGDNGAAKDDGATVTEAPAGSAA